jgi:hypothetical protein
MTLEEGRGLYSLRKKKFLVAGNYSRSSNSSESVIRSSCLGDEAQQSFGRSMSQASFVRALVTEQVLDVADIDAGSIQIRRTLRAKIAQTEVSHARGFDVARRNIAPMPSTVSHSHHHHSKPDVH